MNLSLNLTMYICHQNLTKLQKTKLHGHAWDTSPNMTILIRRTSDSTQLTTQLIGQYKDTFSFSKGFPAENPSCNLHMVLQGRISLSMYIDMRPNIQIIQKHVQSEHRSRLSRSSLKHTLLCPAKPHPSV